MTDTPDPQQPQWIAPRPASSASLFLWGSLIAIVGGVLLALGQSQALSYAAASGLSQYGESDGSGLLIVGTIVAIVGAGFVIGAIYRALERIDLLHADRIAAAARDAAQGAQD